VAAVTAPRSLVAHPKWNKGSLEFVTVDQCLFKVRYRDLYPAR
jgi:hypothetical protein